MNARAGAAEAGLALGAQGDGDAEVTGYGGEGGHGAEREVAHTHPKNSDPKKNGAIPYLGFALVVDFQFVCNLRRPIRRIQIAVFVL